MVASCVFPKSLIKTQRYCEREVTLVISDVVLKGYQECSFSVKIGDSFSARVKWGDRLFILLIEHAGLHMDPKRLVNDIFSSPLQRTGNCFEELF